MDAIGAKLDHVKGFGEKEIRPRGQHPIPDHGIVVAGHGDDFEVPRRISCLEFLTDLDPVHAGHPDIQDQQIRIALANHQESLHTVLSTGDLQLLLARVQNLCQQVYRHRPPRH